MSGICFAVAIIMKNQKGFIQIPLLLSIIVSVLVLGGGGYFGIKKYQNNQAEKIEQKKQAELNPKIGEEQRQKMQGLLDSQGAELEKQKSEIGALKNKKPEIIQQTIIKEAPTPKTGNDIQSIIKQWKPVIAYIECDFLYSGGEFRFTLSGSGTLFKFSDGTANLFTNKHVILDQDKYDSSFCRAKFLEDQNVFTFSQERRDIIPDSVLDIGNLVIKSPDEYVNRVALSSSNEICHNKASMGDPIVILGFPGIGSKTDITATEGIISSYDGDYYVTSAKVEHGNSGGAAISIKDNCYLGIPTFTKVGEVESLARILDARVIWHNN